MGVPVPELLNFIESDVLKDVELPRLVPRTTLLLLLNEAYKVFARRTHCFVCTKRFIAPAGIGTRMLPGNIVAVHAFRNEYGQHLTDYTRRASPWNTASGRICAYTTDREHRTVQFYPTPDTQQTLYLTYAYLPDDVTDDTSSLVKLDHDHAYLLPEWVVYRALRNNDPDSSATIEAEQFRARWEAGVLEANAYFTRFAMGPNASPQPRSWT